MNRAFLASVFPILAVATGLAVVALRRRRPGLAAWCLALVAWATSLLLAAWPPSRGVGNQVLMVGYFVPAAFLHTVLEDLGWRRTLAWAGYGLAAVMFLLGLSTEDWFLRAGGTQPGPWFVPMFTLSGLFSALPCALLMAPAGMTFDVQARAAATDRARYLLAAGVLGVLGGGLNILTTLIGTTHPAGLYVELAALALLTWVVQVERLPRFSRFVEASLGYTAAAALLSSVFYAGILALVPPDGGWFLLFLLVLVSQPVLGGLRGGLARRFFPGHAEVGALHQSLAAAEAHADHARRLAEIGTLASAVAHEVRNPVGVIQACVSGLRRQGADEALLTEIQAQVDRTARFASELLSFARPEPGVYREVEVGALAAVAANEVRMAVGPLLETGPLELTYTGEAAVEADAAQLQRLFVILFENATLVGAARVQVGIERRDDTVVVTIEDDGPGVPPEVEARLFEPFVSGRGRDGPRPGTGLGLAIARAIVERHQGTLQYVGPTAASPRRGARFRLTLPVHRRAPVE